MNTWSDTDFTLQDTFFELFIMGLTYQLIFAVNHFFVTLNFSIASATLSTFIMLINCCQKVSRERRKRERTIIENTNAKKRKK